MKRGAAQISLFLSTLEGERFVQFTKATNPGIIRNVGIFLGKLGCAVVGEVFSKVAVVADVNQKRATNLLGTKAKVAREADDHVRDMFRHAQL